MDAVLNEYLYPVGGDYSASGRSNIVYHLSRCPLETQSFYAVVHVNSEILYELSANEDGTIYWHNLIQRRPGAARLEFGTLDRTTGVLMLTWRDDPGDHFLNATYEGHFETMGGRLRPPSVNKKAPTNWSEEGF